MASNCLFCRIAAGDIPSSAVYSDDEIYAFRDINPAAPQHILVIPRRHIQSLADAEPEDAAVLGRLLGCARTIAEQQGFAQTGFRSVFNTGVDGGQTVGHLHLHLLAGRAMHWPPG